MNFTRMRKSKGFTLVELMVVMSIIAILATLVLPQVTGVSETGRGTVKTNDIKVVSGAVDNFNADEPSGKFPTGDITQSAGANDAAAGGVVRWDAYIVEPQETPSAVFGLDYVRKLPPHHIDTNDGTTILNATPDDVICFGAYLGGIAATVAGQDGSLINAVDDAGVVIDNLGAPTIDSTSGIITWKNVTPPAVCGTTSYKLTTGWPTNAVWTLDADAQVDVNLTNDEY